MPPNAPVRLLNVTCVYCGAALADGSGTKEHVIGRRFVPKGKLDGNWNLIVNACAPCNGKKSDLENDISAITMQPDAFGRHGHDDATGASEAARKAQNAISRRTKKPVKDSHERMNIKMPLGPGASVSFGFTAPAQLDEGRVFELARLQLMGFFYLITYNDSTQRGGYWIGGFYPVMVTHRADWGNPVQRAFAEAVADWEPRVLASNADGFFKVLVRRHPGADCWSWALEWNHSHRVIGFFGDEQAARDIAASFPHLKLQTAAQGPGHTLRFRTETALDPEEDKLFYWDDGSESCDQQPATPDES